MMSTKDSAVGPQPFLFCIMVSDQRQANTNHPHRTHTFPSHHMSADTFMRMPMHVYMHASARLHTCLCKGLHMSMHVHTHVQAHVLFALQLFL